MSEPNEENIPDPVAPGAPPGDVGSGDAVDENKVSGEPLTTDEYLEVYLAVLLGEPDPIGTESSAKAHAELSAEVAASPDSQWDIPGEIPNVDPKDPETEEADPVADPEASGADQSGDGEEAGGEPG